MRGARANPYRKGDLAARRASHKRVSSAAGRRRSQHHPRMARTCQSRYHQHLRRNRSPDEGESNGIVRARRSRSKPTLERGQGRDRVPEFNLTSENYVAEITTEGPLSAENRGLRSIIRYATSYRQAQMLASQGIEIDRATLALWVGYAAAELAPLAERLRQILLGSPKITVDETPAPVLDPGRGRTKIGYFWAIARDDRPWGGPEPPAVVYTYIGRSAALGLRPLVNYCGIVQCDGYAAISRWLTPGASPAPQPSPSVGRI